LAALVVWPFAPAPRTFQITNSGTTPITLSGWFPTHDGGWRSSSMTYYRTWDAALSESDIRDEWEYALRQPE